MSSIGLVTFLTFEYDEAKSFFTEKLNFSLVEDTDLGDGKRWLVVSCGSGASLLIAKAVDDIQLASVGNQTGGRVGFFITTDDFTRDYAAWTARGVKFREQPRTEPFGVVAVFEDLYGAPWDLIQPT
jgi:catechol 2,3-dioxygenase-like lactoylglutathione lyase family enzyme